MTVLDLHAHVALLVDDAQSVVLLRRVVNGAVRYQAPCVAVEPGETPGKAALRAALE